MRLSELCHKAEIEYFGVENPEIKKIVADSREAESGALFVSIRGLHTNGALYIAQACSKGAAAIIVSKDYLSKEKISHQEKIILIPVENPRLALARLCNAFCGFPAQRLKLIGVTGTNGKTTVCRLIKEILESAGHTVGMIGTLGAEFLGKEISAKSSQGISNMTTPDPWVLYPLLQKMQEEGAEYVVMEVSSHALALSKVEPLHFAVGIFTNLTPEHLDFHKDMDSYAKAKQKLFAASDVSVINMDSPYAQRMSSEAMGKVIYTSVKDKCDNYAVALHFGDDGVRYKLIHGKKKTEIACPIPGIFTVANTLQAAVCAMELGIDSTTVRLSLSHSIGVKGRMERVDFGEDAEISALIDYAHTPDALEKFLQSARQMHPNGRLILVFGCGGDRDREKRPLMGKTAQTYADMVFVTSDNARGENPLAIIEEVLQGFDSMVPRIVVLRSQAIREAVLEAEPGDLILLAGKGHEEYEISAGKRRKFSEREILFAAYEEKRNLEYGKTLRSW